VATFGLRPNGRGFADGFLSVRAGRLQCEQDRQANCMNKNTVEHIHFSCNGLKPESIAFSKRTIGILVGATVLAITKKRFFSNVPMHGASRCGVMVITAVCFKMSNAISLKPF
jgi:hypothetical protein